MRHLRRSWVLALVVTIIAVTVTATPGDATAFAFRTLDGSGNNPRHPDWGRANTLYLRVAPTNYADGISSMPTGPAVRYVSNRIFNDVGQNIFSKNGRSEEHTSELQSPYDLVCRLLLEKKKNKR